MSSPNTSNCKARRLIALVVAAAILNLPAMGVFASSRNPAESLGTLSVSGVVTVNNLRASSGLTVLSGSNIVTSNASSSILELGKQTRLVLSEKTELALDFSEESISGWLQKGAVHVFVAANRRLTLTTPAGVIATDSSQMVAVNIQIDDGGTRISVEQGRLELRSGKDTRLMVAGETLSTPGNGSMLSPVQNLNGTGRVGIIAGIGAGLAILLLALSGDSEDDFGGCAIIVSDIIGGPCR